MKQIRLLTLLALLLTAATGAWAQGSGTKIYSVDFSDHTSYPFYNASESATVENGLLVLTNSKVYAEKYEVQPEIGRPTPITAGKCYRIAIQYKTTVGGPVNVVLGAQDWSTMMGAWWVPITVSDNFQTLEATFLKCSYGATDNHILFQFGDLVGTVYIKKVEVYEFDYVDVTGVTLSSSTASVNVGDKVALTATVAPDNATEKAVKWSVGGTNADAVKLYSDEDCTAEVGADATSALTVYAKGLSAGEATVTVVASSDETKSATCTITVNPTYAVTFADDTAEPTLWTASPNADVTKGQPVTVTYTGTKKVLGVKAEKKKRPEFVPSATIQNLESFVEVENNKDGTITLHMPTLKPSTYNVTNSNYSNGENTLHFGYELGSGTSMSSIGLNIIEKIWTDHTPFSELDKTIDITSGKPRVAILITGHLRSATCPAPGEEHFWGLYRYTNPVKVTYNLGGGSVSGSTADKVEYLFSGDALATTFAAPTREGFTFDGWYTSAEGGTKLTASNATSATTIYAHWNAIAE